MKIAIAHDYLAQFGGAERVVATWANSLPYTDIYTMMYNSSATFPELAYARIRAPWLGRQKLTAKLLPVALPALPYLAKSVRISDSVDCVLASTSGFAHGFKSNVPVVAYCHSPARWLYEAMDYRLGLSTPQRLGLALAASSLKRIDQKAAAGVARYIANSKVTQDRIWSAYRRESEVVHPPVSRPFAGGETNCAGMPDEFGLCVARQRGYKNLALAINAAAAARLHIVIVGEGTEKLSAQPGVTGLGRVSDGLLANLYSKARVLIATAHEDFGLTVVEAAYAGTPTVAINRGGYRETVIPGRNGLLAEEYVSSISDSIIEATKINWNRRMISETAERFSPDNHSKKIISILHDVTGGS